MYVLVQLLVLQLEFGENIDFCYWTLPPSPSNHSNIFFYDKMLFYYFTENNKK